MSILHRKPFTRFWTLSALALQGAYGCSQTDVTGESIAPTLLLGVMEDGVFRPIEDGDRVPGVFGSQGALMVVGSIEVHGVDNGEALEIDWASVRSEPGARSHSGVIRRRPMRVDGDVHGEPGWRVESLYWVIEWVALDFDAKLERRVTIQVGAYAGNVYVEGEAAVTLDIIGDPFPAHGTIP